MMSSAQQRCSLGEQTFAGERPLMGRGASIPFFVCLSAIMSLGCEAQAPESHPAPRVSRVPPVHSPTIAPAYSPKPPGEPGGWIEIAYRELVDMDQLTRSGRSIREILNGVPGASVSAGQLQPFLAQFTRLLPHVLDMDEVPDLPRFNVANKFASGSRQPAWAAIARAGSVIVTDDGKACASVFVAGSDPQVAYEDNYGVIRHILGSLLPEDGSPLTVSAYCYKNDYESCSLSLCTRPFVITTGAFPPPRSRTPLDVPGLRDFFDAGVKLVGGRIEQRSGRDILTLVGEPARDQVLDGKPADISDLAVAYRAIFHAGANLAFVSLDPHRDPTQVTVSYGGFLEDTHIGSVVLEADKRFKTITCGLDPDGHQDVRQLVRNTVHAFATVGERDLCRATNAQPGWVGTRFWYYPDSVEIEADLDYKYALIRSAFFTADAERSRDDYATNEAFERLRQRQLSSSIRVNIDHLNQHYDEYARAFPELAELTTVARFFGVCVWLLRANADIDLDALLGVELPASSTPRALRKLIAASAVAWDRASPLTLAEVEDRSITCYLSDLLDQRIDQVFLSDEQLARFLARASGVEDTLYARYLVQAREMRRPYSNRAVRSIIKTDSDLRVFAEHASSQLDVPPPPTIQSLEAAIEAKQAEITKINGELEQLSKVMERSITLHNRYVGTYNHQAQKQRLAVDELDSKIARYNDYDNYSRSVVEIGGGIGLEPERFTIRQSKGSPGLQRLKHFLDSGHQPSPHSEGKGLVRTRPSSGLDRLKPGRLGRRWRADSVPPEDGGFKVHAMSYSAEQYWKLSSHDSRGWRDQVDWEDGVVQVRSYDSSKQALQVAVFQDQKLRSHIVAERDSKGRIVFKKSPRHDLMAPASPPLWWQRPGDQ